MLKAETSWVTFSAVARSPESGCTASIRPAWEAAASIWVSASSYGARVFATVRGPFTSSRVAIEALAFSIRP